MKRVLLTVVLLPLACAPQPSAPPAQAAPARVQSGPRVILPDGFVVSVEVANTEDLRAQGLMFRDQVKPGAGMVFFFANDGVYPFWMKNTLIPLDMIWIDSQKRIAHVKKDVPPCKVADCPSYDPGVEARYVLELAAGEASRHGLAPGGQLRFEGMDSVTVR